MVSVRYPAPMTILVVDAEAFSLLRNPQQLAARRQLYTVLGGTFKAMGVPWQRCLHEDRGDGALVLFPHDIPKPVILGGILTRLGDRLSDAARQEGGLPLRIRVALHAGDVHTDRHGVVGSDVNHTFRLADCAALRQALRQTRAWFAVIVSDALYQGTVLHRYDGLDPACFCSVRVRVKEADTVGWLTTPGDDGCARRVSAHLDAEPAAGITEGGVSIQAGGNVSMNGAQVAGRDIWTDDRAEPTPSVIPSGTNSP